MNYRTAEEIRMFLLLCLDPGHGIKRTPAKLTQVMPAALRDSLETHAPHLAGLRADAEYLEAAASKARTAHATALEQWIRTDQPDATPDQTTPTRPYRSAWPAAVELQQAADILRADGDHELAGWLDATANAMAWLAPYREHEPAHGMWEAAQAVARKTIRPPSTTTPDTEGH